MRKLTVKANTAKLSAKAAKILAPAVKPTGKPSTVPLGTAAADQAKRSNVVAATKPATPATSTVAKPAAGIARTIRTIALRATNFGGLSDRDESYFSFYKQLIGKHGGSLSVAQMHADGGRPNTPGTSNKPHDAGAINRLVAAKLITETGGVIKLTPDGISHKAV